MRTVRRPLGINAGTTAVRIRLGNLSLIHILYGNPEEGVKGCIANGIDEKTANQIYDDMIDFAKYAFNKSHAAAYAAVSYTHLDVYKRQLRTGSGAGGPASGRVPAAGKQPINAETKTVRFGKIRKTG